ncbi:MAG: hypothetical protein HUJ95_04715, partial [Bacteroidales bacterium]|nr:hypothetical protein [Bacteroidales bacterium]
PLKEYVYGCSKFSFAEKAGEADGIGGTQWDVARQNWKSEWRMPTLAEVKELCDENNCTLEQTTINGVIGQKITSVKNGKSIFVPYAGFLGDDGMYSIEEDAYLHTSTPSESVDCADECYYWSVYRTTDSEGNPIDGVYYTDDIRSDGLSIRPVIMPKKE